MKNGFSRLFSSSSSDAAPEEALAFIQTGSENGHGTVEVSGNRLAKTAGGSAPPPPPSEVEARVRDRVVASLLQSGAVTTAQIREAHDQWSRQGEKDTLWRTLARHPKVDRGAVYAEAARIYAFREVEVTREKLDPDFVRRVIEAYSPSQQERAIALCLLPMEYAFDAAREALKLVFATPDPTRPETLRLVHELGLEHFELTYAPEAAIAPLLDELFPRRNEYLERLEEEEQAFDLGASYEQKASRLVDEEKLEAEINRSSLINLFEAALVEAVRVGASDLHIYPNPHRQTEFHLRVDGELQHWHTQDKVHPEAMLAVVKDRCLNIDRFDREIAQDGYIQRSVDEALIRYRVSILPIASANREVKAESIVIRVLDDRKIFNDLGAIGLLPEALARFQKAVRQPNGMIIMTGPTGSGKSTTLAAALHQVISPKTNVLTVEDPVEYIINGVRQVKLGPRLHLENALRSLLRHDPDVVMVGEMRDKSTAELAIKLANTGHLTFSTLHTNDAPSAVSRLYKMGVEPFLIAYAINLVVAQRLVRKLCPTCKQVDNDPDQVLMRELGFSEEEIAGTTFYRAGRHEQCHTCRGVGYKGRRAISEALYFSRAIRHLIVEAGGSIDEDAIRDQAIAEGMLTLVASAREVVKRGETTVEEILRVTAAD